MSNWPNFFVVGAPKAGTTSLNCYLKATPGIFMSAIKEPHFFSPIAANRSKIQRIDSEKTYLELFRDAQADDLIGEVSPAYLRDTETPNLIKQRIPAAKIIILLRDPGERAYSHYQMVWRSGTISTPLEKLAREYIEGNPSSDIFRNSIIQPGLYSRCVQRYLNIFGNNRAKIIIFDEFIQDTEQVFKDILDFLGVGTEGCPDTSRKYNDYFEPRNVLAHSIIRNSLIRRIGKALVSQQTSWKIIRHVFGKKAEKQEMPAGTRQLLSTIYQDDVIGLRRALARPGLWLENYPSQ